MQRIVFDNENKKSYEIADSNGNVRGVIYVETTDLDIFTRAEKAGENIQKILENEKITDNMDDRAALKIVNETDRLMKEQIDYVFGAGVSEIAFGDKKCLNIRNGKTLAEVFIEAMMNEVNRDFGRQVSVNRKNISKYTKPYNSSAYRTKSRRKGGR